MNKRHSQGGIKGLIIGIILVCLVLGYYYYLSNRKSEIAQEEVVKISAVQEVLMRNLDNNYPPTPREVVKYYCQITQCFYGETYTEEEFQALAFKIQELYDDELVANKTQQQYLEDLRWDVNNLKEQGVVISSYALSSSTDVEEFKKDGFTWAKLYCAFTLRQKTKLASTEEIFLLRKDENGHWKIYGWKLADEVEQNDGD